MQTAHPTTRFCEAQMDFWFRLDQHELENHRGGSRLWPQRKKEFFILNSINIPTFHQASKPISWEKTGPAISATSPPSFHASRTLEPRSSTFAKKHKL